MAKRRNSSTQNKFELQNIKALTPNQQVFLDSDKHIVAHGCAGTGKTFLAMYVAFKAWQQQEYGSIKLLRSTVPSREMGFLPGTDKEKSKVYETPYIQNASKLFGRGDCYEILKQKGDIEFMTTSFVRGITMDDSIIVVDECQNMTYQELDSIITRLGDNSRFIFCGDWAQSDLNKNGIKMFYDVLRQLEEFEFIEFTTDDIVRSSLVKNYLVKKHELYGNKQIS